MYSVYRILSDNSDDSDMSINHIKMVSNSEKLLAACQYGDYNNFSLAIRLIYAGNVDVNYYNGFSTPLNFALHYQNFQTAKYLLGVDQIDINKSDLYGTTPLHFSCCYNQTEIIRTLCTDPACTSLDSRDSLGRSPIMVAVEFGNIEAVREMVKIRGVDLSSQNIYGESLADIAKKNGRLDIISLIKKKLCHNEVPTEVPVPKLVVKLPDESKLIVKLTKESGPSHNYSISRTAITNTLYARSGIKTVEYMEEEIKQMDTRITSHRNEQNELNRKRTTALLKAMQELRPTRPTLECPVCMEDMGPHTQIFQCQNGHLVCGTCKPYLASCSFCRKEFMGRAIGMEQFIRNIHAEDFESEFWKHY
eukprot:GFUD01020231.1.p1 GENE.GFUD01020231.1~~GFUD01020231.1.p1  ORF type:complete len:363 (-),score=65.16 GFUD01020231.1:90-1178(-)